MESWLAKNSQNRQKLDIVKNVNDNSFKVIDNEDLLYLQ